MAGDVTGFLHPVGYTISTPVSAAQRITQVTSSLVDSTHPAAILSSVTYTPFGAIDTLVDGCVGTNCVQAQEKYTYNNRLQPAQIQLGTAGNPAAYSSLVYNYLQGTANNGNVMGYTYQDAANPSFNRTEAYTYDSLSRLATAVATGNVTYNLTFAPDRYGNMTCQVNQQTQGLCTQVSFNSATNQITTSGYTYDAAGNTTADTTHTYQWDAEGRMISIDSGSTAIYTYNALGQRVVSTVSGATIDAVYDPFGSIMAYLNTSTVFEDFFPPLAGRQFAKYQDNLTYFLHANSLGTTGMVTNHLGAMTQDLLYYPWGQVWTVAGAEKDVRFASLGDRDAESSLDPTLFRMYESRLGRWLSPDPVAGDILNPQSLNRYAYAVNNPTTLIDPLGLWPPGIAGIPVIPTGGIIRVTTWAPYPGPFSNGGAGGHIAPLLETRPDPGGHGGGSPFITIEIAGTVTFRNQFTLTAAQVMSLVAANNESDFCNELIDCIVFKESAGNGGFYSLAVPMRNGRPLSTERGLMQVNRGGAAWVARGYEGFPSAGILYDQLFDPAVNIQAGSALLQLHVDRVGGDLRRGLIGYGTGTADYADSILNCVLELQGGNVQGAIGAAHGAH